jgi:large subunit ribosomal protein L6
MQIYSDIYFILIPIFTPSNNVFYDYTTNQVFIKTLYINNFTNTYANILREFFKIFIKPNFKKIKFKGKGYYIYKNYRNTITPQFGYSHRLYIYAFYTNVLFLSKTSLLIFGLNYKHICLFSQKLRNWRRVNIFTGRGVRFSKQIIYRKSGKVSTYR